MQNSSSLIDLLGRLLLIVRRRSSTVRSANLCNRSSKTTAEHLHQMA